MSALPTLLPPRAGLRLLATRGRELPLAPRRALHTSAACQKSMQTLPDMVAHKPWSAKVILLMCTASFVGAFLMGFNASKDWVEQNPEEVFRKLIPAGQPWPVVQKTQGQDQVPEQVKAEEEKDEIQRAKEQLAMRKTDLGAQLVKDTLNTGRW